MQDKTLLEIVREQKKKQKATSYNIKDTNNKNKPVKVKQFKKINQK